MFTSCGMHWQELREKHLAQPLISQTTFSSAYFISNLGGLQAKQWSSRYIKKASSYFTSFFKSCFMVELRLFFYTWLQRGTFYIFYNSQSYSYVQKLDTNGRFNLPSVSGSNKL